MQMTPFSIPVLVTLFFEKVESAGELELDLCSIVEWVDGWLVTFNATKTKPISFNRCRDPLLVPVEMNRIELPEETLSLYKSTIQTCMEYCSHISAVI